MNDDFDLPTTGNADLPAKAAKAAGWGFLALFGLVAFVAYRKFRR